jgi:hypothetical protein
MPRLVNRFTGSTVNVPEEKVENLRDHGFDPEDGKDKTKTAAKKAAAPKK